MKKFTQICIMFLSISLIFISCKKDDKRIADNTLELLQNKNWKLTAATENSVYGFFDVYNDFMEDCDRDNLFKFNSPDIYVLDEGPSKCNPSDDQTKEGTWSYTASTKTLHLTLNGTSEDWDLLNINENTFSCKLVEVDAGITSTSTSTFTRQ